ncbi:MAG: hypothetical protein IH614_03375 [Desulfuromonadales bacterium]|nr:hypothetical protein [Desulfuromonadales bacterium]
MGRLILWPGLGADERMFTRIQSAPPLITPRHLLPRRGEDLPAFARRSADALGIEAGDVIGGSSFGGVVAAAIARQRPVRALVLIGGALDAGGLRPIPGEQMVRRLPPFMVRPLLRSERALQHVFAPEGPEVYELARRMLNETPDDLLLYGGRMLIAFRPAQSVGCPVFALHGGRDPVMSPPPIPDCRLVAEAGHGLAWTHAAEVTAFLRQVWSTLQPAPGPDLPGELPGTRLVPAPEPPG